jgi:hypothetical protein
MFKKLLLFISILLINIPISYAISTATCFNSDCSLMIHANGTDGSTTITDSSISNKTVTTNGSAQLDTAQYKFGTASVLFDGNGDYLISADSNDWSFGGNNFTIDFWVNYNLLPTAGNYMSQIGQWASGGDQDSFITVIHNTAGNYTYEFFYTTDGSTNKFGVFSISAPSISNWYHIAFVRSGTNLYCFVDGVQQGSTYNIAVDSLFDSTQSLTIGADNSASHLYPFNGWMDEFRITKGAAIWTTNFTPPSNEYLACSARRKVISTVIHE